MPSTKEPKEPALTPVKIETLRAIQHFRTIAPDVRTRITLQQLGERIERATCTVHCIITALEAQAYIERQENNRGLKLTPKGVRLLKQLDA